MERVADISRGTSAGRRIICTKWLIFEECDKLSSAGFTTLILWLNRYWQPTRQLKKKRIRGDWPRKRGLNQWKRQRRIAEEEAIRNMTEKERVLKAEKRVADEKRWAEAKRIAEQKGEEKRIAEEKRKAEEKKIADEACSRLVALPPELQVFSFLRKMAKSSSSSSWWQPIYAGAHPSPPPIEAAAENRLALQRAPPSSSGNEGRLFSWNIICKNLNTGQGACWQRQLDQVYVDAEDPIPRGQGTHLEEQCFTFQIGRRSWSGWRERRIWCQPATWSSPPSMITLVTHSAPGEDFYDIRTCLMFEKMLTTWSDIVYSC